MNVAYLALTAAILGACVFGLWRLLRSEPPLCVWIIVALSALALLLRLVEYSNFPGGLNEDEPSVLSGAMRSLENQDLFGEGSTGLPQLIPILFQAQLVPLVGGGRWAIRLYSLVFSVLAVGATFGVARSMRMRPISSLAAAAFVVVLPWSLFYGRISQGGELLFNQLLLLAALSRLIWRDGTWREIPLGALALCLLFYDYFSGRAMLAMPFVAMVLASGLRKRLYCVIIPVVAFFGFLPQLLQGHQYALVGLSMIEVHPSYTTNPLATLAEKFLNHLYALYLPVAGNGWMTVSCGAMHPAIILILAVLGLLTGFRRGLFLLAGFMVGMMPGVLSHGDLYASTHRILSAYIFICLAAGASFDLIPWRSVRAVAASAVVVFVTYWSLTFYFSSNFWRAEATWMFSNPSTDITESIPWNEPRVIEADIGSFMAMRVDLQPKQFGAENLFLPGPALYVFGSRLYPLRPFYEALLLPGIVKDFGGAFSIRSSGWDSDWLHGHGWGYEITCESNGQKRAGQIPTLFHYHYTFSDFVCPGMARHIWRGKWNGPATDLRLWFDGSVTIETSPGGTFTESGKPSIDFKVQPGAGITIRVNGQAATLAALYVVLPRQERLPYWEWVDPIGLPEKRKGSS